MGQVACDCCRKSDEISVAVQQPETHRHLSRGFLHVLEYRGTCTFSAPETRPTGILLHQLTLLSENILGPSQCFRFSCGGCPTLCLSVKFQGFEQYPFLWLLWLWWVVCCWNSYGNVCFLTPRSTYSILLGGFQSMGVPENSIEMDDLGVPPF